MMAFWIRNECAVSLKQKSALCIQTPATVGPLIQADRQACIVRVVVLDVEMHHL